MSPHSFAVKVEEIIERPKCEVMIVRLCWISMSTMSNAIPKGHHYWQERSRLKEINSARAHIEEEHLGRRVYRFTCAYRYDWQSDLKMLQMLRLLIPERGDATKGSLPGALA